MPNRLILKVTKFQLRAPKRLGTVVKNILGASWPLPCQNRINGIASKHPPADTFKITSRRIHGELAIKETLMRNFQPNLVSFYVRKKASSIEHRSTSAIYIFMAPLTLFNEAPKHKSFAPLALKNAYLWLSWPSLMRGYQLNFLYVGVFGVPAHFLIYGKVTGFLFVIGCSR